MLVAGCFLKKLRWIVVSILYYSCDGDTERFAAQVPSVALSR